MPIVSLDMLESMDNKEPKDFFASTVFITGIVIVKAVLDAKEWQQAQYLKPKVPRPSVPRSYEA